MKNYIILILFSLTSINNFGQISIDNQTVLINGDFQIESGWTFNSDRGSLNNLLELELLKELN